MLGCAGAPLVLCWLPTLRAPLCIEQTFGTANGVPHAQTLQSTNARLYIHWDRLHGVALPSSDDVVEPQTVDLSVATCAPGTWRRAEVGDIGALHPIALTLPTEGVVLTCAAACQFAARVVVAGHGRLFVFAFFVTNTSDRAKLGGEVAPPPLASKNCAAGRTSAKRSLGLGLRIQLLCRLPLQLLPRSVSLMKHHLALCSAEEFLLLRLKLRPHTRPSADQRGTCGGDVGDGGDARGVLDGGMDGDMEDDAGNDNCSSEGYESDGSCWDLEGARDCDGQTELSVEDPLCRGGHVGSLCGMRDSTPAGSDTLCGIQTLRDSARREACLCSDLAGVGELASTVVDPRTGALP